MHLHNGLPLHRVGGAGSCVVVFYESYAIAQPVAETGRTTKGCWTVLAVVRSMVLMPDALQGSLPSCS